MSSTQPNESLRELLDRLVKEQNLPVFKISTKPAPPGDRGDGDILYGMKTTTDVAREVDRRIKLRQAKTDSSSP